MTDTPYTNEELAGLGAMVRTSVGFFDEPTARLLATIAERDARIAELEEERDETTKQQTELADMVEHHEQDAGFKPEATAPKDGRLLEVLVQGAYHTVDDAEISRSIGHNGLDHTGEDEWEIVGWCWEHDHWTQERQGIVIGWREMRPASDPHFLTPWCAHTQNTLHQRLLDEAAEIAQHLSPIGTVGSVFNEHTALVVSTLERAAALVAKPQDPTPPEKERV